MISVLITTLNEELDLQRCLSSASWSDDVHVYDSFSADRTAEIATAAGARVSQRKFDGYASQKNAALRGLKFKYGWVLLLDADEIVPAELAGEMRRFVEGAGADVAGARIRRRDFLYDTWLKRAAITPYYLRLVRPERAHFEREINEVMVVDGDVATLTQPFDHFPFSKGLRHWVEKHNRYSTMEAEQAMRERAGNQDFSVWRAMFDADRSVRRVNQKGLFYRTPGRPFLKWCYMMFWRCAFLDGRAGITYACLQAVYEYFIVLKERELKEAARRGKEPARYSG